MIKFNKFHVLNKETGEKTKVWYSVDNRRDGKPCVLIQAKEYCGSLAFLGKVENDSDIMTDYFEKDRVYLFEGDKYYKEAREAAMRK